MVLTLNQKDSIHSTDACENVTLTCELAAASLLSSASTFSVSPQLTWRSDLLGPPGCLTHRGPAQLLHSTQPAPLVQGSPLLDHAL